jgi:hypothetical protein
MAQLQNTSVTGSIFLSGSVPGPTRLPHRHGAFYVKSDGKPYFSSSQVSETDLTTGDAAIGTIAGTVSASYNNYVAIYTGSAGQYDHTTGLTGSHSLVFDAHAGKLGIGTKDPLYSLHATGQAYFGDSAGGTYWGSADDLIVENNGSHAGITIHAGATSAGNLVFSDGTSSDSERFNGVIQYVHSGEYFRIYAGGQLDEPDLYLDTNYLSASVGMEVKDLVAWGTGSFKEATSFDGTMTVANNTSISLGSHGTIRGESGYVKFAPGTADTKGVLFDPNSVRKGAFLGTNGGSMGIGEVSWGTVQPTAKLHITGSNHHMMIQIDSNVEAGGPGIFTVSGSGEFGFSGGLDNPVVLKFNSGSATASKIGQLAWYPEDGSTPRFQFSDDVMIQANQYLRFYSHARAPIIDGGNGALNINTRGDLSSQPGVKISGGVEQTLLTVRSPTNDQVFAVSGSGRIGMGAAATTDAALYIKDTNEATDHYMLKTEDADGNLRWWMRADSSDSNYGTMGYHGAGGSDRWAIGSLSTHTTFFRFTPVAIGQMGAGAMLHVSASSKPGLVVDVTGTLAQQPGLLVAGSGRIGVGTDKPSGTMHIMVSEALGATTETAADDLIIENKTGAGMVFVADDASNQAHYIAFRHKTNNGMMVTAGRDGSGTYYGNIRMMDTTNTNYINFEMKGADLMRLDNTGLVYISHSAGNFHISGSEEDTLFAVHSYPKPDILRVVGGGRVGINATTTDIMSAHALTVNAANSNVASFKRAGAAQYLELRNQLGDNGAILNAISADLAFWHNTAETARLFPTGRMRFSSSQRQSSVEITGSETNYLLGVGTDISSSILFVTGSGRVGLNTSNPSYPLTVKATKNVEDIFAIMGNDGTVAARIDVTNTNNGLISVYRGGVANHKIDGSGHVVFNEAGLDKDFRVESDNDTHMLFVDGEGFVGIGIDDPTARLHISSSSNGYSAAMLRVDMTGAAGLTETPAFIVTGHHGGCVGINAFPDPNAGIANLTLSGSYQGGEIGVQGTHAPGAYSFAHGVASLASSDQSFALGNRCTASMPQSFAWGYGSKALDDWTTAGGKESVAGPDNGNSANGATAIGYQAEARNLGAVALGWQARAEGQKSYAFGHEAIAQGNYSYAFGEDCVASGSNSYVFGEDIKCTGNSSMVFACADSAGATVADSNVFVVLGANVGIGTSGPSYRLDVLDSQGDGSPDTNAYIARFRNDGNHANSAGIIIQCSEDDGEPAKTTIFLRADDGDGTAQGTLQLNTDSSFTLADTSDIKLKDNIRPTKYVGLDVVKGINICDFEWKKNGKTKFAGVVAQNVEEFFPEAVSDLLEDNGEVTKTVSYISMVPPIIKAMQEQQEIIEKLLARVEELENKID